MPRSFQLSSLWLARPDSLHPLSGYPQPLVKRESTCIMLWKTILVFLLAFFGFCAFLAVGGLDLLTGGRVEAFKVASIAILEFVRRWCSSHFNETFLMILSYLGAILTDLLLVLFILLDAVRFVLVIPVSVLWYFLSFVYLLVVERSFDKAMDRRMNHLRLLALKRDPSFNLGKLTRNGILLAIFYPILIKIEVDDDVVSIHYGALSKWYFVKMITGNDLTFFTPLVSEKPKDISLSEELPPLTEPSNPVVKRVSEVPPARRPVRG
jgi:hypothetical protein